MEKELAIENNLSKQSIKSIFSETFIFITLGAFAFFTPIILQHPQILIGIIINMALFRGAVSLKKEKLIALAIFPSLGVLASGILFANLTKFIIYLIPFIWVSNIILMNIFSKLQEKNYFKALTLSVITKTLILFSIAFIFYQLNIIPKIFLGAMSYIQLITATIAGIIIFLELKLEKIFSK